VLRRDKKFKLEPKDGRKTDPGAAIIGTRRRVTRPNETLPERHPSARLFFSYAARRSFANACRIAKWLIGFNRLERIEPIATHGSD
jgi:hypothetical protein